MQSNFGVGILTTIPSGANPTPVQFGALQDVSMDISWDQKPLHGSFQFPLEMARGKGKLDLKASIGRFDPVLFNQVVFGLTTTTGETRNAVRENGTIPTTPFQITAANGATFALDQGVYDVTAAKWLARGATSTGTGVYAVNTATGVYTFNTADVGHVVQLYYSYTAAGTGVSASITNQLMGAVPTFRLTLVNQTNTGPGGNKFLYVNFPAVQSQKLSMPMKLDDFTIGSIDMSAFDDGAGNVYNWSMTN